MMNSSSSQIEYVEELIKQAGVVAVPGCGFFHANFSGENSSEAVNSYHKKYIRFAFCKSNDTLAAAARKLGKPVDDSGCLKINWFGKNLKKKKGKC